MSYIEREAVLKIIADNCPHDKCGYNTEEEMGAGAACYYIRRDVENIPTADVEEVRHGEWISNELGGYKYAFYCSECGWIDGYPFNDRHKYCPNCGAKMDGGSEENEG